MKTPKDNAISGMARFILGAIAGMCLEYAFRVESEVWYIPFCVGMIYVLVAVFMFGYELNGKG